MAPRAERVGRRRGACGGSPRIPARSVARARNHRHRRRKPLAAVFARGARLRVRIRRSDAVASPRSPEPGARSPEPGARSPEPEARSPKPDPRRAARAGRCDARPAACGSDRPRTRAPDPQ
ncbi:hypothetical protein D3228_13205 [Leucobacter luti]|nr:hypothetical protein [Leucobacter luti]